ncbi:DNA methyltransferase [Deinococcus sp. 6GRE01]|uniref:DNA methyltransferase n=1 Tax=Deinococcus sp. 6GRE01 TaxID=2745873 RepID=UPI001E474F92|nr:DNA methyltransferase [Deinococcus sp. 6GRE01]MCD0155983.1 helicase [Deinococcus sp. 6GRE01]
MTDYDTFLADKIIAAPALGFTPTSLPAGLKAFQLALVTWALERGRAALFAERGLGKAFMELAWADAVARHTGQPVLILAPLAVSWQLAGEAQRFGIPNVTVWDAETAPQSGTVITNYEKLDRLVELGYHTTFAGVALDESSILKSFMGKTKQALVEAFRTTPYRLAATATPSPNDTVELGNHAEFLGLMEPGEMLTRWFINDTTQAQTFRLKRHGETEYWAWVSSWARALRLPSDLGEYSDDGYVRPAPEYHVHTVQTDHSAAPQEDGALFRQVSASATSLHKELRGSLEDRARIAADLVNADPEEPWLVWAHTNAEADALRALIPDAVDVRGNQTAAMKERLLMDFAEGRARVLITKPTIAGWGLNFQHCARQVFASLNYSFEELYQAVGRSDRYGQTRPVQVHLITTDTHSNVLTAVQRKQTEHTTMQGRLIEATRAAQTGEQVHLTVGPAHRRTVHGDGYTLHNGDCVAVTRTLSSNSHDFQIFSPPFSNLYSYSPDLRDMGNTDDDTHFFTHFGYLIPELRRTLKPGRLCAVHVKNLQVYKSQDGYTALRDFRGDCIRAFLEAQPCEDGSFWTYHSEICIWTDPVREMQRTKAHGLLYKNIRTDAANNRQGVAEHVIVFRKWGPDMKETPKVTHDPAEFTLDMWQQYASPVWFDINRTDVLNAKIARADDDEKHLAPLQLEVIRRCVRLWTNPGEVVFTPFLGVGSEAYGALQLGRRAEGVELKPEYFTWADRHCRQAADEAATRLFSLDAVGA